MYYDCDEHHWYKEWHDYPHYIKQRKPFEGHYADKNEARLLRRIMSETGLDEAQVRSIKKYRVMLSDTQKKQGSFNRIDRVLKSFLKSITRDLKLAKEHPKVKAEFDKRLATLTRWNRFGQLTKVEVTHEQACNL